MALTFVEKVRGTMIGKAFRVYEVTGDGSTTTVDASDLDLSYIDYAIVNGISVLSGVADYAYLSTTSGTFVVLGNATSTPCDFAIQAWGW